MNDLKENMILIYQNCFCRDRHAKGIVNNGTLSHTLQHLF